MIWYFELYYANFYSKYLKNKVRIVRSELLLSREFFSFLRDWDAESIAN